MASVVWIVVCCAALAVAAYVLYKWYLSRQQQPPLRYDCDRSRGRCVAASTGYYPTERACSVECTRRPPMWECVSDGGTSSPEANSPFGSTTRTFSCVERPNGTYPSFELCKQRCSGAAPMWKCENSGTSSAGCRMSPDGKYTSAAACQAACVAPRYACDPTSGTCVVDSAGQYASKEGCAAHCAKPSTRWYCDGNFDCVPGSAGKYTSKEQCLTECASPSWARYDCRAGGVCYLSDVGDKGKYPSLAACRADCKY